jgi:hypothetical protein
MNRHPLRLSAGLLGLFMAAASTMSWVSPAEAASVSGVARDPGGRPLACSFVVLGEKGQVLKTVTTDSKGGYSVFLQPGIYLVRTGNLEGVIQALISPSQQDVRFLKR